MSLVIKVPELKRITPRKRRRCLLFGWARLGGTPDEVIG